MSYIGMYLNHCNVFPYGWDYTRLVVVSGDGPNICGHALINVASFYFHIAGAFNRPCYMTESGYRQYLEAGGKTELFRRVIHLPNPEGAQRKLEALSVEPWLWLGIPNNCVSYVEEILQAGGANEALLSNCPVRWR